MKRIIRAEAILVWLLLCFNIAQAQDPGWVVDYSSFSFRMTVSAVVEREGELIRAEDSKIAVFVNDEIRGVGSLSSYHEPSDKYLAIFQVGSNVGVGEDLTFSIYDKENDVVVHARNQMSFQSDTLIGSVSKPIVISDNMYPTDIMLSNKVYEENTELGEVIAVIITEDFDDENYTYAAFDFEPTMASSLIEIVDDEIQVASIADYEELSDFTFTLEAMDPLGVTISKEMTLVITDVDDTEYVSPALQDIADGKLPLANYISPNGDGVNDFLTIQHLERFEDFKLQVFNPRGVRVFFMENYDNSWDGRSNGEVLPSGVYYYIFENDQRQERYQGSLYIKDR